MAMMKQPFRINVVLAACLIGSTVYSVRNDDANPTIPWPTYPAKVAISRLYHTLEPGGLSHAPGVVIDLLGSMFSCAGAAGGPNVNIVFI